MSHIKDIDEREADGRDALAPDDLMLVDLLYGELDENARERAEQRVRGDQALSQDLDAFSSLRALMRELPEAEPSEALSAKLLHAAAAEVPRSRVAAEESDEPKTLWGRLKSLFMPIALHPGLAAAASVVLVAGIAGVMYVSGDLRPAVPMYKQAAEAPAMDTAAAPAVAAGAPAPVQAPEGAATATLRDEGADVASGAPARQQVASTPAATAPDPAATGADDYGAGNDYDYGAEEQSPRQFAQAPAELEAPAANQAVGRGGYAEPAADKDSSLARKRVASAPQPKEEARRAKAGKKLDLADAFEGDLGQVAKAGEASTRSSAAPGSAASGPQGTIAGASGGGGAPAPRKPVAEAAKPKSQPAPATPPPPPQAAPAEPAEAEAADEAAPADRKAPARAEEKARERNDGKATRVSELHQKALAAAARGDCATVRASGNSIRQLDPSYHRDSFARDARLQECLSAAVKKK